MVANPDQLDQFEGQWDEPIQHPDQFAGRRVRVTVLSDEKVIGSPMLAEIRRWLGEGDALKSGSPGDGRRNVFADGLVDKFRKQRLVL
jgi:hypothetical protein